MRNLPSYISQRLNQNIQIWSNKTDINSKIWVSRPSTVLLDERLLERQTVTNSPITDVSIAVCHPRARRSNTEIYIGYISNCQARIVHAKHKTKMSAHEWFDTGFVVDATAISVAFDGTMPRSYGSEVEFVTEEVPWIFWVDSSTLYGKKLGLGISVDAFVLAETNCTDVSAIRAMWSSAGGFDFGLVVFFIVNGKIFYRQLIDDEWMDAEAVTYGPEDVTWKEVAAFRTWDYRIGIQAKTTTGAIYELYTQFMGIGKQNTEHIDTKVDANTDLIKVKKYNLASKDNVSISSIESGTPYGGLYSTLPPNIISAYNIEDENGDWGKKIVIVSDVHLRADEIASNFASFAITDSLGRTFSANSAELSIEDGLTITLTFEDFNAANGECIISYTPGTAITMADTKMKYTELAFTPINLVAPEIPVPEVVDIWNLDSEGNNLAIQFTEAIIGDINGNETKFTITMQEYDMVPEGTLREATRTGTGIKIYSSEEELIDLNSGTKSGIEFDGSVLSLEVT